MESFTSLLSSQRPFPFHTSLSPSPSPSRSSRRRSSSLLIAKAELEGSGDGTPSADAKRPAGFGTSAEPKKNTKKERGKIIRRSPVERPSVLYSAGQEEGGPSDAQQGVYESAFLLTWLGLGLLIFVEGIALAASGFLPEEWDNFFVKYLYPSFTPTVFLFVGGTVTYGVIKYLQGEKTKS